MTAFAEAKAGFDEALLALIAFVRVDRALSSQIPAGRSEFFALDPAPARVGGGGPEAQRFLEWFALERRADGTGGPPIIAFANAGCPGLAAPLRPFVEALAESRVGVFAVREADDQVFEAEEAVTGVAYRIWMPLEEGRVAVGGTLAGRVARIPDPLTEDEVWLCTDSTEAFASLALFEAYGEEARRSRLAGKEPQLQQLELEQVLRNTALGAPERIGDLEAECARYLAEAGATAHSLPGVDELSYALSTTTSPGSVIGPFLEEVAFHSELDLETGQRLCLRLWNAHKAGDAMSLSEPKADVEEAAPQPPRVVPERLGQHVLEELEEGLVRGEDIEGLFGRLESIVEDAAPTVGEPEEAKWQTEDQGDLAALSAEYLWERERGNQPMARPDQERLRGLVKLFEQRGSSVLEALDEEDLAAVLVDPWSRGDLVAAVAIVDCLAGLIAWAERVHHLSPRLEASSIVPLVEEERQRTEALAQRLESEAVDGGKLGSWRVTEHSEDAWRLECENEALCLPSDLPLRVGDLILGEAGLSGFVTGFRVLPSFIADAV